MKKVEFVGIDVSKATIDVKMFLSGFYKQFKNTPSGINQMLVWVKQCQKNNYDQVRYCFEHTGIYSDLLSKTLSEINSIYYQVSGLMVKKTLGLARGKNDIVDAKRLGEFAFRYHDKLVPYKPEPEHIRNMKSLLSIRNKLINDRKGYKAHLTEIKAMGQENIMKDVIEISQKMIKTINEEIEKIEAKLKVLIKSDNELEKTFNNIISIKGIGLILGTTMIAMTNNFTTFDNWRKFACYIGTAPFEHTSGTSFKGKTRVSIYGNRKIKSVFFLCASSAIQHNPEMREYYKRKTKEGKTKMTAINGVINKLISRIFAVAKRQTPWVDIYKFAA